MYKSGTNNKQMNLSNLMRSLWEQHVMWTRMYIISNLNNLEDLKSTSERLLRNPIDFSNALVKYYGYDIAEQFKDLLSEHLLIAANLVNHAKVGDMKSFDEDKIKWYENAGVIAAFLAGINPYWSKQEWQKLLYDHLNMTLDEATYYLNKQYDAGVDEYDKIEEEALRMADYMTEGMAKQFKL